MGQLLWISGLMITTNYSNNRWELTERVFARLSGTLHYVKQHNKNSAFNHGSGRGTSTDRSKCVQIGLVQVLSFAGLGRCEFAKLDPCRSLIHVTKLFTTLCVCMSLIDQCSISSVEVALL